MYYITVKTSETFCLIKDFQSCNAIFYIVTKSGTNFNFGPWKEDAGEEAQGKLGDELMTGKRRLQIQN